MVLGNDFFRRVPKMRELTERECMWLSGYFFGVSMLFFLVMTMILFRGAL